MIDQTLIEKKIRRIETFLQEIESAKAPEDFRSFSKDIVFKRFTERNIELAVEQMIDVCKHFVSGLNLKEPETYAECFEILAESDIVSAAEADTFKSMARYRNLLIHGYDGVDDEVTYGIYKKRLDDFRKFAQCVRDYVKLPFNSESSLETL